MVKHPTRTVKALVRDLHYRLDVNTLHRQEDINRLGLNEIGRATLRLTQPLFCDPYSRNRQTGGLILIDEATSATGGAALITPGHRSPAGAHHPPAPSERPPPTPPPP